MDLPGTRLLDSTMLTVEDQLHSFIVSNVLRGRSQDGAAERLTARSLHKYTKNDIYQPTESLSHTLRLVFQKYLKKR